MPAFIAKTSTPVISSGLLWSVHERPRAKRKGRSERKKSEERKARGELEGINFSTFCRVSSNQSLQDFVFFGGVFLLKMSGSFMKNENVHVQHEDIYTDSLCYICYAIYLRVVFLQKRWGWWRQQELFWNGLRGIPWCISMLLDVQKACFLLHN